MKLAKIQQNPQALSMRNLATYVLLLKTDVPMKLQIDNDNICTSMKTFNSHQTTGECQSKFDTLVTRLFQCVRLY